MAVKNNRVSRLLNGFSRLNKSGKSYIEAIISQFRIIEESRPSAEGTQIKQRKQQIGTKNPNTN
jgi:hypothetical protein